MVKVAVAGGTGGVGKTIVEAIASAKAHDVIVLTRRPSDNPTHHLVDYSDADQIADLLISQNVHTVISTIAVMDEASGASERALVVSAAKAYPVRRFVASNWGSVTPSDESLRIPFQVSRIKTIEALRGTNLEWTSFQNGYFLDFYGMPYLETNLKPLAFVLDMTYRAASIPGTGNETMTFTHTKDLGRFVNASLDLPQWSYPMVCYSHKTTWNKALQIAEEARGMSPNSARQKLTVKGCKFHVTYDSIKKLQSGEITELPFHATLYNIVPKSVIQGIQSKFGLYVVYGLFDVPEEGSLNQKFPEIRTSSLEDIIGLWKGH